MFNNLILIFKKSQKEFNVLSRLLQNIYYPLILQTAACIELGEYEESV